MTSTHEEPNYNLTGIDYALAITTLPFTLFILMFATSGMTTLLESPRKRRTIGVALLTLEIITVALIVTWAISHSA